MTSVSPILDYDSVCQTFTIPFLHPQHTNKYDNHWFQVRGFIANQYRISEVCLEYIGTVRGSTRNTSDGTPTQRGSVASSSTPFPRIQRSMRNGWQSAATFSMKSLPKPLIKMGIRYGIQTTTYCTAHGEQGHRSLTLIIHIRLISITRCSTLTRSQCFRCAAYPQSRRLRNASRLITSATVSRVARYLSSTDARPA